jgi:hypothetical protein
MSIAYCRKYEKYIDTDYEVELYEECEEWDREQELEAKKKETNVNRNS